MKHLQDIIETAFENRQSLSPQRVDATVKNSILETIALLDQGQLRVAEKINNQWQVHQWVKKAVILSFTITESQPIDAQFTQFYDKVPLKYQDYTPEQFQQAGTRVVPHALVRKGAFVGKNTVLMPSYINIGAFVDSGSMVDTWATVGSCAQVGKNVHISGGVGLGGVLEPLQANPTIIEDNVFVGARSEIVEGVIIEEGAVISMGVYLSQSTKIYHRETGEISYGRIPAGSVVVPGSLPAKDGSHALYAAIIVKQVDLRTREKVGINQLLRNLD